MDTTYGIRVDAIMRQDGYPISTWGMGVIIYYDEDNWVGIKQGAAGGQQGWLRQGFVNGVDIGVVKSGPSLLRQYSLISGVELTDTQIKFWGSSIDPLEDHFGDGEYIDYYVNEITDLTMSRPAEFTGDAVIIIGKGYTALPTYPNPDMDNSVSGMNYAVAFIDYVRIQRNVYTPDNCGDAGTVYLSMDFDQNCYVDFKDLAEFASSWLLCNDPLDPGCD